jgi:hypothetical protein
MGPIGSLETSATDYKSTLRNILEEYLKKYSSNIHKKDRNKSWGQNADYVRLISGEACRYHHSTLKGYWSTRLRLKRDVHQSHTNINEACR